MKSETEIKYRLEPTPAPEVKQWKPFKPVIDLKRCTACKACALFCPHAAITIAEKKPRIDYDLCDGCLICLRECHEGAIKG